MLETKGVKDHKDKDHYLEEFLDFLLANYMEDARLLTWMGDRIFKKPPQEISGPDGGPIELTGVEVAIRKV